MDATRTPAPRVTREQLAAVMAQPTAVATLDLTSLTVTVTTDPAVWENPTVLVLVTHDDVMAAAAEAAGHPDFLGRITRIVALDLHRLAAAGEIPTAAEVAAVLAELAAFEAEVIDLDSYRTA
jgi:hypothetical protein